MECAARERLKEVLKIATHEFCWVLNEQYRIATQRPQDLGRFEPLVAKGHELLAAATTEYREHVEEHGCHRTGASA